MIDENCFANLRANTTNLAAYGFCLVGQKYCYQTPLIPGFIFKMTVVNETQVTVDVLEEAMNDRYLPFYVKNGQGHLVGQINGACTAIVSDIVAHCFEKNIFQTATAQNLITHVREKYGDELEYLWPKFPDNAVWRRQDTRKWYAVLMVVPASKIGLPTAERVEIIDLRADPTQIQKVIDRQKIFPAYHMNKNHWLTIPLDGTLPWTTICAYVDQSYALARK